MICKISRYGRCHVILNAIIALPDSNISDGKTLVAFGNRNALLKYFKTPTLRNRSISSGREIVEHLVAVNEAISLKGAYCLQSISGHFSKFFFIILNYIGKFRILRVNIQSQPRKLAN